MSAKMMQFVSVPPGHARQAAARACARRTFAEIYGRFAPDRAAEQASRCEQCGVPFCQVHCPLHNHIPDWLRLAAEGRLEEAYELSSATNNMPEICGRICPQDRLCEGNCVIEQSGHGSVTIGAVEKYITDTAFDMGWVKPVRPLRELAAVGRHHRRRPGRARLRRGAAQAGLAGACLRPLRPGRRAADLRHPRLQAGEADRRAPGAAPARQRHPLPPRQRHRRRRPELRRAAPAPRCGAHRHRRLQGARPRGARLRPAPASCRRSTSSPPATARAWATRSRPSTTARSMPPASMSWSSAAATPRWTACAPRSARVRSRSSCLYRRDRANMPGSHARGRQRRGGRRRVRLAVRTRGLPRRRPGRGGARAPDAAGRARRLRPPGARDRAGLGLPASRPIWSSRRWASIPRTCRRMFGEPALKVSRWGTVADRLEHDDDQPARRVRRRRHRARRLAGGLGRARRPRCRRTASTPISAPAAGGGCAARRWPLAS